MVLPVFTLYSPRTQCLVDLPFSLNLLTWSPLFLPAALSAVPLSVIDFWIPPPHTHTQSVLPISWTHSPNVAMRKQKVEFHGPKSNSVFPFCPGCDNAGLSPWQRGWHVQQLPCQWWALGGHGISRRRCLDRHCYSYQVSFFTIQASSLRCLLFFSRVRPQWLYLWTLHKWLSTLKVEKWLSFFSVFPGAYHNIMYV